jgi:hypothetical protein
VEVSGGISAFLEYYAYFGILACLTAMAGMLLSMPFYSGRAGERYSPLNHFVSELGEVGISPGARVFNGCLIAAGVLFLPFTIGLGLAVDDFWAKLGMITGAWTSVSLMLVGMYSMDRLEQHVRAALSFFDSGFVTIILFTIGIWAQPALRPIIPRAAGWVGIGCILIYAVFLAINPRPRMGVDLTGFLDMNLHAERPGIWSKPILEWLVVLCSILWYLATALIAVLR